MKKNGGARTPVTRVTRAPGNTTTSPRESWRMWVITLLALGFALLVMTLLMKENTLLRSELLQNNAQEQGACSEGDTKNDKCNTCGCSDGEWVCTERACELLDDVELPLDYSLDGVSAKAFISTDTFTDYTAADLEGMSNECGAVFESGYFDSLVAEFLGTEKTVYTFSYTEPSQEGNYVVTVVPNIPGYTTLEELEKDFNLCVAGGDMYPHMVNEEWIVFTSSCGSGYDNGSGLPLGCQEMRQAIEPTLQLR